MEQEKFFSGYCRQLDAARMVEVILENGEITETGTHSQLIETSEKYRKLYETQFKKVIDYESAKTQKI